VFWSGTRKTSLSLGAGLIAISLGALTMHAEPADAAQFTLSWVDNAAGSAWFEVERKVGATGVYSPLATTALGATTFVDSSVNGGSTYCYRVRASNDAGDSSYSNEACATPAAFTVQVTKQGTGAGSFVSVPVGITCGTDCGEIYPSGTVVTLSATAASGSTFAGWNGGGCTGTGQCVMASNSAVTVAAAFTALPPPPSPPPPTTMQLTIQKAGQGTGTVTSLPAGIACGTACQAAFPLATVVKLTPTPATGSVFTGWSGAADCADGTVTLSAALACTATFSREAAAVAEIIIDNGTAGTRSSGKWSRSSASQSFGGASLLSASGITDRYFWTPDLPVTGQYEVWVWWTSRSTRSPQARYKITHANGISRLTRDQRSGGGQWQLLGTYSFTAGTVGSVMVSDANGGVVSADAVRFVRR
jgi:hypothetical protein